MGFKTVIDEDLFRVILESSRTYLMMKYDVYLWEYKEGVIILSGPEFIGDKKYIIYRSPNQEVYILTPENNSVKLGDVLHDMM